jgi:hypothetical protein
MRKTMINNNNNNGSNGGGFFMSLLAVLFIGLKLTGYITWSWWWVLAPLWGPVLFLIIFIFILWMAGLYD